VLAARTPSLHRGTAGREGRRLQHVNIDGTLIETDRCAIPGPPPGVDLW
jgi:hypothetical protein